ncbi:MAG TPA: uroporphyrinogen-III synthase [Blastocatellia bacterium]|nr:uroporphyrinogen-III synthase [Blastocatellia bacterium]
MANMKGARVALLEGRKTGELASIVRSSGGEPYSVPSVQEAPLDCKEEVNAFIDRICGGSSKAVLFQTGVGAAELLREAGALGRLSELLEALKSVTTVCRGPKPTAVLKKNSIPISVIVPEPFTTHEILETLGRLDLTGKRISILNYGERNNALAEGILEKGIAFDELCLYEWRMPDDLSELKHLVVEIAGGKVDAVAFTSQVQVRHLFKVAKDAGQAAAMEQALNGAVVVASIGPTTSACLKEYGVTPDVMPEHPKMGHLIHALAEYLEARRAAAP